MTRREVITSLVAASAVAASHHIAWAQGLPLPNKDSFESGDFVWPKKPGAYVPYNSGAHSDAAVDEQRWMSERRTFLERAAQKGKYFTDKDLSAIRQLTYREFYARYAGDQSPGVPGTYTSGAGIYVGHVGVLEKDQQNEVWVVEALMGKGVVRTKYQEWIRQRPGEIVWHGRVRDIDASKRASIVQECKKQLGKPYDFWNFDLSDDTAFYCSKLVWLSVSRSLGFPIDGNENPRRVFWFSPKQLLYAKTISRLHDPGPYANL